jgi:hypothetical protein
MSIDATGLLAFMDSGSWTSLTGIVTILVGLGYAIVQNHYQIERMKITDGKVAEIQETSKKTAAAVNGQLSGSLITGAVAARALAVADPTQLNQDLATTASKIATDHLAAQAATAAQTAAATEAAKPPQDVEKT